ncbi:MAG TPA: PAS domain-containing protein [Desulfobulbus sp.]|nr:PAS domain-containing protein [Desulfobulbus sp.]
MCPVSTPGAGETGPAGQVSPRTVPGPWPGRSAATLLRKSINPMKHARHPAPSPPPAAVLRLDNRWRITGADRRAERFLGRPASDLVGRKGSDILCGGRQDAPLMSLCAMVKKGHSFINQLILLPRGPGEKQLPVLVSVIPVPGPDGSPSGAVLCLQEASSPTYIHQLALDSITDGVLTVDDHLHITSANAAAAKLTGREADRLPGMPWSAIFAGTDNSEDDPLAEAVRSGTRINDRAIFLHHSDGSVLPAAATAAPLHGPGGEILGGVVTLQDSLSRIQARLILDSVADGVFTVDRNWKITSFNRAAEEITGWPAREALGTSCSEVFRSSICGRECAIAQSLYSGCPACNRSITIRNRRGSTVPVSISAAPLVDNCGNIIGGVETFRDLSAINSLRKQLTASHTVDEIVSRSPVMQRLLNITIEIARSPSTVLIQGESGTGKELFARAIYNASDRSDKPFVIVNCGALPETLLESELFGYKAGAFTDARKDKEGRFAAAEGGTLFLDEIGDIPGSVQVKLLRVLQEKMYEPLGSNEPVRTDVRIITATNRDLQALVRAGSFREDLYYRLNVARIQLPPLRERKEDIPLLIEHFIEKFRARQDKDISGISEQALQILMRHDFPGNIRELENIIEYAFILCRGGLIEPEHLPEPLAPAAEQQMPFLAAGSSPMALEEIEKQAIWLALERNRWKKMATCRELKISKDTLRRKIKKYGLKNPLQVEIPEEEGS